MAKNEVRLRLDGAPEHRGHVLAQALVQKIDRFLKTFGRFERAYLGQGFAKPTLRLRFCLTIAPPKSGSIRFLVFQATFLSQSLSGRYLNGKK